MVLETELPVIDTDVAPKVTLPIPDALPGDCDVKSFVLSNLKAYSGDDSFLAPPTERTLKSWRHCEELLKLEAERGILSADPKVASTITSREPDSSG